MFETLKIIHFLALMLGGAASVGNIALSVQAGRIGGSPPPLLLMMRGALGKVGLTGITLLWITGGLMAAERYGGEALGTAYTIKLIAAAGVFVAVVANVTLGIRAAKGNPPPPHLPPLIGNTAGTLAVVAVVCAVITFA